MDYNEIRKKPNFLYHYFLERGGKRVDEQQFNQALDVWFLRNQTAPFIGRKIVEKYLDSINIK